MATLKLSQSRAVPVPVEEAFDRVLPHPLPEIFRRRSIAIPPIKEVRDQVGQWGAVGETRTIVTTDGGTLRETLTSVERPGSFGYTITPLSGPMKPLIASAVGRLVVRFRGDGHADHVGVGHHADDGGALADACVRRDVERLRAQGTRAGRRHPAQVTR